MRPSSASRWTTSASVGRRWRALEDLRWVNRWLGGYTSVQHALRLLLTPHRNDQRPLRLAGQSHLYFEVPTQPTKAVFISY